MLRKANARAKAFLPLRGAVIALNAGLTYYHITLFSFLLGVSPPDPLHPSALRAYGRKYAWLLGVEPPNPRGCWLTFQWRVTGVETPDPCFAIMDAGITNACTLVHMDV